MAGRQGRGSQQRGEARLVGDQQRPLPYSTSNQLGAAVAFNSVPSIPYALDGIEDSLSAASPSSSRKRSTAGAM